MTPDKWAAMQTAANQADSREWIVAVGWGALAVLLAAWCVLAVVWWRNEKARRTFEGRTWR